MVEWKTTFASPLYSTTSKHSQLNKGASAQQNRMLDNCTSGHQKVGELKRTEQAEPREQQRCCNPGPLTMAARPMGTENPEPVGKVVHTTVASKLHQCPWLQVTGQQWKWGLGPCPSSIEMPMTPASSPSSTMVEFTSFTTTNMAQPQVPH